MSDDTVTIPAEEYHNLQVVADIVRKDYIAINSVPGSPAASLALLQTTNSADWTAAVEALDGIGS